MTKVAPPAFASGHDASQWLLFVGATTTTPLGQVKTFDWTQAVNTSEQMRVSDSTTHYTDQGVNVTGALELWQGATSAENLAVGGKVLTVDDVPKTLIAVFHDAEATSGSAVDTYTFTNFRITSINAGPREGQSASYSAFNWRATLLAVT
jgi:hypothetical protein